MRFPAPSPSPAGPLTLSSPAFASNGSIPRRSTCDGADASPPLAWSNIPAGTVSLALLVSDPDARGFVHWVAFAIDPAAGGLPEGASGAASGFREGRNSFGQIGWNGPCPPSGTHHYVFELLALDAELTVGGSLTADQLRSTVRGHTIGSATLVGVYRRS
jgi:Raf kinase inhibitor-like YbhB/YbcL family protein